MILATDRSSAMTTPWFMFATGVENSYPTINNGRTRIDEMEKCGHYRHWRTDFALLEDSAFSSCATGRRSTRRG
jgi:hypothetical protein